MTDSDPRENLEERFLAVSYVNPPADMSEIWQIVFNEKGDDARLVVIHDYIPVDEQNDIVVVHGYTYQTEPFSVGFKKVSRRDKKEASKRLRDMYDRNNQIVYIKNRYLLGEISKSEYQEEKKALLALPKEVYDAQVKENIEDIEKGLFYEMPEQEAKQKYMEFLMLGSKEEVFHHQQYIEHCKENDRLFDGIRYT